MLETHSEPSKSKKVTLEPNSEYRFEIPFDNTVELTLISGLGEIFGCELAVNKGYLLTGCKYALYTYQGCEIMIRPIKVNDQAEKATEDHWGFSTLEWKRNEAIRQCLPGPKVLIIGNGRNSLSKILLNYAVRSHRQPLWVDLDINNGELLFPGTLSALIMDKVIDIEEGVQLTAPVSYFYGHIGGLSTSNASSATPGTAGSQSGLPLENVKYYKILLEKLSRMAMAKLDSDDKAKSSGFIITCFGWSDHPVAYELLRMTIDLYMIDHILVVGNERLHSELNKKLSMSHPNLNILKTPKSGGLVAKSTSFRRQKQVQAIKRYFYGSKNEYSPFPLTCSFNDLHIRRIGEGPMAPSSALPLGASRKVDETRLVKVELLSKSSHAPSIQVPNTVYVSSMSLLNQVLALSSAEAGDEASILDSNIIGYVSITEVDETKNKMTLLSPCPGKLPKPYLMLGSIRFTEK